MRRYYLDPLFRDEVKTRAKMRSLRFLGVAGVDTPKQLNAYLMERDKGICGICEQPVTENEGPMRPSPDHKIPLAAWGDRWMEGTTIDNIQLSHLRCNLSKGARGEYDLPEDGYAEMIRDALRV